MEDFMKKIQKEIDKGMIIACAKSKEFFDWVKIQSELGMIRERKRQALEDIGQVTYRVSQGWKDEAGAIGEKCEALKGLEEQIRIKENELQEVRQETKASLGKIICMSCGATLAEEAGFCSHCGKEITK